MPEIQPHRETEGSKKGVAAHARNPESRGRRRGRPPGAKNKPKTLLPAELANEILLRLKDMLPPDHFDYIRGVVKDGKAVSLEHELDVLILLLSRNITPVLIEETMPRPKEIFDPETGETTEVPGEVGFRKDVTERLKVLNSLLSLKHQVNKNAESDNTEKPIFEIFARRGVDRERFAFLLGVESRPMVGDSDGTGREGDDPRTVSDTILERQVEIQGGEQESPVGLLYDSEWGDGGDGSDEDELRG